MRKMMLAAITAGAAGCVSGTATAQTPTYLYLGLPPASVAMPGGTGWTTICRERISVRSDQHGRPVRVLVPGCNLVWIGRRYFHNGSYYADPTFTTPIN